MKKSVTLWSLCAMAFLLAACSDTTEKGSASSVVLLEELTSEYVAPRKVAVYLPPGYRQNTDRRYPVWYMLGGAELFSGTDFSPTVNWRINETIDALAVTDPAAAAIVVGIWDGPDARREYTPAKPFASLSAEERTTLEGLIGGPPASEAFLDFLTRELKPYIDREFRTLPEAKHTNIAGAGMGGLLATYAVCERFNVFRGAASFSTHWTIAENHDYPFIWQNLIDYFGRHLPPGTDHVLYFDYGTGNLDTLFDAYQLQMDARMISAGFKKGINWETRKYAGGGHSPASWGARFGFPYTFIPNNGFDKFRE